MVDCHLYLDDTAAIERVAETPICQEVESASYHFFGMILDVIHICKDGSE